MPVLVLTPEPADPFAWDGPRGWSRVPADGEWHYDPGPGAPRPDDHPAYWRAWALWNAAGGAAAADVRGVVGQLDLFRPSVAPGLVDRCLDDLRAEVGALVDYVRASVDMEGALGEGPLDLDVAAGQYLQRFGQAGRDLGAHLKRRTAPPATRFGMWLSPVGTAPPIVRALVDVLSADRWATWSGKDAALPALVLRRALGRRPAEQWKRKDAVDAVDAVDAALPVKLLRTLGTVATQRLLRFLARDIAYRASLGVDRPEILEVEGGYPALAARMGMHARNAPDEVSAALASLEGATLRCDDDEGGWSTLIAEVRTARRAVGGTWRSVLRIEAGPPLRPGFVLRYNARTQREARQLAPVWDLPPLDAVGPTVQPAAARLDALSLVELRRLVRSPGDVERGVPIPWAALADEAELARPHLVKLLKAWQEGPDPRWRQTSGGRWAPAETPATAGVVRHLRAAGALVEGGRRGGRGKGPKSR